MSRTERLNEIAKQLGRFRRFRKDNEKSLTSYISYYSMKGSDREKAIVCINFARDYLIEINKIMTQQEYYWERHKENANKIMSALASRFDDDNDDDYTKWTDEQLFTALKLLLRLPELPLTSTIQALVDARPDIQPNNILKPGAIIDNLYIVDDMPLREKIHTFCRLYVQIFQNDKGLYLLQMRNWALSALFLALTLLGDADHHGVSQAVTGYTCNNAAHLLMIYKNPLIVCMKMLRNHIYSTYSHHKKRNANKIMSALAFRFDDKDDNDYTIWTNEELFTALKNSLRLPVWEFTSDIQALVDMRPDIEPKKIVKPGAVNYILENGVYMNIIPDERRDEEFREVYKNVFEDDEGFYLLKMGNWTNIPLLIVLILLGAEYDITRIVSFRSLFNWHNKSLGLLTEDKNPFMRTGGPQKLRYLSLDTLTYRAYRWLQKHVDIPRNPYF